MRLRTAGMMFVFAGLVAACQAPQPEPRTYFDFMEDGIAREGVLARCNRDRDATLDDQECSNARRAAAAIALEEEQKRSAGFARESQRKLAALRDRSVREQRAEREAEEAARKEAELAYERRWPNPDGQQPAPQSDATAAESAPAFGAPLGPVLPSISEGESPEPSEIGPPPSRPAFGVATAEPPSNSVQIVRPELRLEDIVVAPQHLRAAAE